MSAVGGKSEVGVPLPAAGRSVAAALAPTVNSIAATGRRFARAQWRQLALITAGALAVYATMRLLPTGTNLNHMDFRVQGGNSIEFCDVHNPQFIPVVAVRSPVTLTVATDSAVIAGHAVRGTLTLRTFSGKPIAPADLLTVHTKLMHLMIVDPSLTDYQHVHPQPASAQGEWTFAFTPRYSGTYRLFADFTPVATGRGLYANADLEVGGGPRAPAAMGAGQPALNSVVDLGGYRMVLEAAARPIRAGKLIDLTFRVAAADGGPVPLGPIMGAYAHVVAFDAGRSGFAHLHPDQLDPLAAPDAVHPALKFKLTIPNPGRYVIWSQVNLAGREIFAPFWFNVEP